MTDRSTNNFRRIIFIASIVTAMCALQCHAQDFRIGSDFRQRFPIYAAGPATDTLEICIMGDMMMHTAQIEEAAAADGKHDFSSYFMFLEDRLRDADIAIANMEFTLAGAPYSGYPAFSAPDAYASYLARCGFDIFLTANNHIFDKGASGAERTLREYDRLGVMTAGTALDKEMQDRTFPLILERKGISIAVINATYGTNAGSGRQWPETVRLNEKEAIAEALRKADTCDFTLVLPHWGTEYVLKHSRQQEELAAWLVDNGADAIIGAHPHVVQDVGQVDGVHVAYSLGNAVSNMSAANTQMGLMATLRLVRYHNGTVKLLPPEYELLWCSRPGGYCSRYTVLPVEEFLGTRSQWKGPWEYDKMTETRKRIKKILYNE